MMRHSGNNIVLPKLQVPSRNLSNVDKTDFFSPARNMHHGSFSVRHNKGPAAIPSEVKLLPIRPPVPTLPPNHALKNFTALELSRFIDKRLTDVAKSNVAHVKWASG